MIEALAAVLVLAPTAAGLAAWFADERRAGRLVLAGWLPSVVAGTWLAASVFLDGPARAFDGLVVVDALGAFVLVLVLGVGSIALLASRDQPVARPGRALALLSWFLAGLAAVPVLDSLGLVWVGIEATTVVSALLVGYSRTPQAIEAAWKYLILGSVGIGFALLGILLVYASSVSVAGESADALSWSHLVGLAPALDPAFVRLGFIFALAGYGTKAGLAPFHTWLPDAHSQAPSPISAVLSGASLAVALYALARFHLIAVGALGPDYSSTLLVAFGLLSLAVALPFIVAQGDLKRLLAYSSIEHLGLASLALGFGGPLALAGFALHLVSHGLAKSVAFVSAGRLTEERGSRRIGRLTGSLARSPAEGRAFLVAGLALAGLPPSGIFAAELAILLGGLATGWGIAAGIAAVLLALAVAGLLFHVMRVAVGPGGVGPGGVGPAAPARRDWPRLAVLGVPLALVVAVGLWVPAPVQAVLDQVAAVLGGGRG